MPHSPRLAATLLSAALLAIAPAAALAQRYDPSLSWRTLDTPHFLVHHYEGEEALARRVAGALERAHELLVPAFFPAPPGRTQVVLADDSDEANGLATVFPYDLIRLQGTPPDSLSELNDYADWVLSLAAHEYTHILHLNVTGGVPAFVNGIFGKILVPNAFVPRWMIEGVPVLHESGPGHGRNASSLFDMWTRAMVTQGGLFPLPEVSNPPLDWPLGNMWYQLGGRFLSFLHSSEGAPALRSFFVEQGRWVWPFAIGVVAEETFGGKDVEDLWSAFDRSLQERYGAQLAAIRQRPVTPTAWLTRRGARVFHPRWSPDGAWVAYWDQGLDGPQGIRQVSPDGRDLGLAVEIPANGAFALRSPTQAVIAIEDYQDYYWFWSDLWLVDLPTGKRERLTRGKRATDPDVLPGGEWVAYVARSAPGEMRLERLWISDGRVEVLHAEPGAQMYLPRISPDGRRVAFEIQVGARRDVAVWEDGRVVRVTDDDALDTSPSWLADGRLLFSSDRGGVYNLYLFDAAPEAFRGWSAVAPPTAVAPAAPSAQRPPDPPTLLSTVPPPVPAAGPGGVAGAALPGRLRQVTNAETGAMQPAPSPDGRRVAYVSYSRTGYDLAVLDLSGEATLDPTPAGPRPGGIDYDRAPAHASRPYDPFPTLVPRYWLPTFGWDAAGFTLGALSSATDAVALHAWAGDLAWSFGTSTPVYDVSYVGQWLRTPLVASSGRRIAWAPGVDGVLEEIWTPLSASLVLPFRELYRYLDFQVGWRGTFYRALSPPPEPLPWRNGFRSMLTASVDYDDTRRFVNSISRIMGVQVGLGGAVTAPWLGSDYAYALAAGSANAYARIPGTRQWVLALHLTVGTSQGDFGGQYPFSLGGVSAPDVTGMLLTALGFATAGAQPDQLRGYPAGLFGGSHLVSGTAELRFPVWAPQWGIATWPFFFRRFSGAVFLDSGIAWVPREGIEWWQRLRFGAGVELRTQIYLAFNLPLEVRVGVARGLGAWFYPGHPTDPYAQTQVYVTLGESF